MLVVGTPHLSEGLPPHIIGTYVRETEEYEEDGCYPTGKQRFAPYPGMVLNPAYRIFRPELFRGAMILRIQPLGRFMRTTKMINELITGKNEIAEYFSRHAELNSYESLIKRME